jgi:hypothetical protein
VPWDAFLYIVIYGVLLMLVGGLLLSRRAL